MKNTTPTGSSTPVTLVLGSFNVYIHKLNSFYNHVWNSRNFQHSGADS